MMGLFRQKGISRVSDMDDLMEVANLFSRYQPPAGNRMAILTSSGGSGALLADLASDHQLSLPAPSARTRDRLRDVAPAVASIANPMDITTQFMNDPEVIARYLQTFAEDENFDFLILDFNGLDVRPDPEGGRTDCGASAFSPQALDRLLAGGEHGPPGLRVSGKGRDSPFLPSQPAVYSPSAISFATAFEIKPSIDPSIPYEFPIPLIVRRTKIHSLFSQISPPSIVPSPALKFEGSATSLEPSRPRER